VTKYWKLPFALLAAMAMLVLWSGAANADVTDPLEPVPGVIDCVTDPTTESCSALDASSGDEQAPALPDISTLPDIPVLSELPTGPDAPAARPELPAGTPDEEGTAAAAEPGPDELAAACDDLFVELEAAGLPAGLDCSAIAGCVTLLIPEDMTLEELNGLTEADLEALLSPDALDGFLTCIEDAVGGVVTTPTPTTPAPVVQPVVQETYYDNCDDARAQGAAPVHAGQPGYRAGLDSDSDGIGCETAEGTVVPVSAGAAPVARAGQLAYTGVEVTPMLAAGAVLLAGGGGLLLASRRRS
jgi:LPXTG-motif cell wall-anchored protein